MADYLPGTEVHARGLRWEVVGSERLGEQTLYRLRGLGHAVLGAEFDLLTPFEPVEPVLRELQPERAGPLPNWLVYHEAFLLEQALGPAAFQAAQPGRLRLEPYQLVPVLRAIRMSRPRLLLADGVGLGKTVQAGLIITELVARRLAHRILIVSPAGPLLEQWRVEMRDRFGLRLETVDRAKLEEIRRATELGANPFDHIPLGLASIDFLKQDRILDQLERASYDIIVIDEAHHCAHTGSIQDREDSLRRRLAEVLASRSDALLLLTATPHDGHDRSFASLCELLDPSLLDGRGVLRGAAYRAHVVRRLKRHVLVDDPADPAKKKPMFPERIVTPVPVQARPDRHGQFIAMQRGLLDLVGPELRRAFRTRNYSDVLSWFALLKRSVSTVAACGETLAVVAQRFQYFLADTAELQEVRRERVRTLREYQRRLEQFGAVSAEEEAERSQLEAEDIAQQLAGMHRELRRGSYRQAKVSDVVAHLDALHDSADTARHEDPKIEAVVHAVGAVRAEEPRANILIYTEYIDSQSALAAALREAGVGPVLIMSGEHDEATRIATTERFRTEDNLILVSTDSSAEGLNLHQRCHHLFHLELPFNPNRLEQRNGRIDRYGQTFEPQVRYFYLCGTFEERILLRLIAKYERQRARLTFMPNTLGVTVSSESSQAGLLKGLIDADERLFNEPRVEFNLESENAEDAGSDLATKELLDEIERSLSGFREAARTHTWLAEAGLNAEEGLLQEAWAAQDVGKQTGAVDLARFVASAVQLDGGQLEGRVESGVFALHLPPLWTAQLDGLPGYDGSARLFRLTTHIDTTKDAEDRAVGYLGRAHPLVKRALDRVRNISFGGMEKSGQDPRVSAVRAPVETPALLYTFLGRVLSRAGREMEQVLAVQLAPGAAPVFCPTAAEWRGYADPARAIRTTDLWKTHFAPWAGQALETAQATAETAFTKIADGFIDRRQETLAAERHALDAWLQTRVAEIAGTLAAPAPQQRDLFEPAEPEPVVQQEWAFPGDPRQRLAAFAADRTQPPAVRAESETVLRLYDRRTAALGDLAELRPPEVRPLGLLMLIPETGHGA